MTSPVQAFRRQSQAHKAKGAGSSLMYDGSFVAEAYAAEGFGAGTLIVSGTFGYRIRVLSYLISAIGSNSLITFYSDDGLGTQTAISPNIRVGQDTSKSEVDNNGLFQTIASESLVVLENSFNTIGARITYILVT